MIGNFDHLRIKLGAEGRHLDAFEEALDQLLGLPCSMGTCPIIDQDRLRVIEGQFRLDQPQEYAEVMLIGALA